MIKNIPKAPIISLSVALAATTVSAQSTDVATTFDEEWIMLSGKVETVLATSFLLDYGQDDITIELDKFDWDVERSVLPGDRVTVTGRMDRNLYDARSIEAATVFVPRLNEYIYADPEDEEGDPSLSYRFTPGVYSGSDDGDWMSFSGLVTAMEGDEIMVDTGISSIRVDTSPVPGGLVSPSVDIGDRVLVSGELDAADLFDKKEVEANSVTRLNDRSY